MNTPSMIVGPSTIILQPHVGRFQASDQEKSRFSAYSQPTFGHQAWAQQHAGAAIVHVWHCMGV